MKILGFFENVCEQCGQKLSGVRFSSGTSAAFLCWEHFRPLAPMFNEPAQAPVVVQRVVVHEIRSSSCSHCCSCHCGCGCHHRSRARSFSWSETRTRGICQSTSKSVGISETRGQTAGETRGISYGVTRGESRSSSE